MPASLARPMVVEGHRPRPRRLHRADCPHCEPPTVLVEASPEEIRTTPLCATCAGAETRDKEI